MKKADLKRYAHLIAKVGANVQKGQYVTLYANVDQEVLANYIVEECYKLGAKAVSLEWQSDVISKTTYKKASVKALSEFPKWKEEKQEFCRGQTESHLRTDRVPRRQPLVPLL